MRKDKKKGRMGEIVKRIFRDRKMPAELLWDGPERLKGPKR